MNYKLEQTPDGPRWVKQLWNKETNSLVEKPLPIGQEIRLNPYDVPEDSSIVILAPTSINDTSYSSLEELFAELKNQPLPEFKPYAWYNSVGDILEIVWEDDESYVELKTNNIEVCRSFTDNRIVGAKIWGLKQILLQKT